MVMETVIFILILLQIKHWYVDFVNQSDEEVKHKGTYLDLRGIGHSFKHGLTTAAILGFFIVPVWAIIMGILDFVLHYHIDWIKMNYGNPDITTKTFWNHLGADQMAHQLVYIFIAWTLI
jgi:hypothetical protein